MKQTSALVSVVMPSYNAGAFIDETIDSVVAQSHTNWELLIVDDGSKDNTRQVVCDYAQKDSRIRLIALTENHGAPAVPRNIGVKQARGDWIAFLDADDIWHPRKLELQLRVLLDRQGVFACTQMQDFHDKAEIEFPCIDDILVVEVRFWLQRIKGLIPTSSVLLRTDVARAYPFCEDLSYKAVEDYHCWLRILQAQGACLKLSHTLMMYRRLAGQISGSKLVMLKRVHMVHREYPETSAPMAMVYSITHALGGLYFRFIKGRL